MSILVQRIRAACEDDGDISIRTDYSGRGMYGRRCVGITGSLHMCMAIISEVIKELIDDIDVDMNETEHQSAKSYACSAVDGLLAFEQDSMGYDVILYWAEIQDAEEPDEELSEPTDADLSLGPL